MCDVTFLIIINYKVERSMPLTDWKFLKRVLHFKSYKKKSADNFNPIYFRLFILKTVLF